MKVVPVILCGGSGTRLWPLSTPDKPKQFQSLTGSESMISLTRSRLVDNLHAEVEIGKTIVVGSQKHQALLQAQLPDSRFILEPFGRNSAPAVVAACLAVEPSDIVLVLPADHDIQKPGEFLNAIAVGQEEAAKGAIVTFGIKPTHPATGYGYIEAVEAHGRVKTVRRFVEKPPLETAKQYIQKGGFYWNAGIFLFKASDMLAAFERHAPDTLEKMLKLVPQSSSDVWNLDPSVFGTVEDVSIDYAIMEHEKNIKVVPVDMGWNDVGGYDALWEMFAVGDAKNASFGPSIIEASENLYVRSEGALVCVSGVNDLAVVVKPEVVMIAPRSDFSAVKRLGRAAQTDPHAHAVSSDTRASAQSLLWTAFDLWEKIAWDERNSGFVEALDLSGVPQISTDRRVRVQARQVYSFAQSLLLGHSERGTQAEKLIHLGLEHIRTKCRHPEGGFVHIVDSSGQIVDKTRDLYDHAFIILCGAAAFKATGETGALDLAKEALLFIDEQLSDGRRGGYFECLEALNAPRRANPHMHLLEAFIMMFEATQDPQYIARATAIVELFESKFFDAKTNILREFFESDWSPSEDDSGRIFQPGHHYEWASLLALYSGLTGRDTISWRRRLISKADNNGRNLNSGLSMNEVRDDGLVIDTNSRIWHQLERFRALALHPGTVYPGAADDALKQMQRVYFEAAPAGTWIDEVDSSEGRISNTVPASILYHLVTAFALILPR